MELSVIIETIWLSTSEPGDCAESSLRFAMMAADDEEDDATPDGPAPFLAGDSLRLSNEESDSSGSGRQASLMALDGEVGGVGRCRGGVWRRDVALLLFSSTESRKWSPLVGVEGSAAALDVDGP